MTTHPDLDPDELEHLRADLGLARPDVGDSGRGGRTTAARSQPSKARALAKQAVARVKATRAADSAIDLFADRIARRLHARDELLSTEVALLAARLDALVPALQAIQNLGSGAEVVASSVDLQGQLRSFDVNQDLFTAELRDFQTQLERLGQAIAPAAGLPGVPERFAELRERVNAIDRRTRVASRLPGAAPPTPPASSAAAPTATEPGAFDYVGFEQRFRGDSAALLETLQDRYVPLLVDHQPVLDFGCGRGELVAVLLERGIEAIGVDPDAGMAGEARARNLPVEAADGVAWLRAQPEHSLGSIVSVHVVEHLELETLTTFLDLAVSRLRPGGLFVAETPNPASLIVLGNSYILDPTHIWPLHPSLLTFLCERAGFRSVEQRYYSPAEAYHLPYVETDDPSAPDWIATVNDAFAKLNATLFGPQEYAVVATTPPAATTPAAATIETRPPNTPNE